MQTEQIQEIYFEHTGTDDINYFEDAFMGIYEDRMDFVCQIVDEMMPSDAPDFLKNYFDYNAFCRDLFIDDVGGQNSWELGGVEMEFLRII